MSFGDFLLYLCLFGWGFIAVLVALAVERDEDIEASAAGRFMKKNHPLGAIFWPIVIMVVFYLAAKGELPKDEGDDS
jgi:hypothetical protein